MKIPSLEKHKYSYLAAAFALPFFGMCLIMLIKGFEPFGNSSMLYSDMYHQYYPFFVNFRKTLLSGESLLWNWSIGMGMDYLGLISYYLASPLYLLSVLVPEDLLLEYFSLLTPIKLGLASLFFAIFLKNTCHRNDLSIAIFGAFYGLCAWAMGYQWNIMWLDTFAMLPLVVLGTVYLIRDRKVILYTVTLFLSVYSNYYIGFFVCLFVFLLFFVYEICRWRGFKRFFMDLCRIAVFSLLAIGMTLFLELPAFAALQNTQSSVNQFPTEFRLNLTNDHTWQGLLDAMRQVAGNMGAGNTPNFKEGLPNIYCGVGTIVLAFLFLTAKQIKVRDKICAVALLLFFNLSFVIRQLDYIWHGFHFPNMIPYRFSFLYSFVMLYMAYRAYLLHRSFKPWQYVVSGVLTVAILLCSNSLDTTVPVYLYNILPFANALGLENVLITNLRYYVLVSGLLVIMYLFVFAYGQTRITGPRESTPEEHHHFANLQLARRNNAVMALASAMVLELVVNLVFFGVCFSGTYISNYPQGTTYTASQVQYMNEREKDTLFYRAEVTHAQTLNDGALNGYNGISAFTSSANVRVTEFLQGLGYSAKNTYNRYCFEESSPISNLFLNLKYMIERNGEVEPNAYFNEIHRYGDVALLQNNAYLPLGFLANTQLANAKLHLSGNRFSSQNALMEAATGIDGNYWIPMSPSTLEITSSSIELRSTTKNGYASYHAENSGTVVYTYTADRDGLLCIDLNQTQRNSFNIYLNGQHLYVQSYALPQMLSIAQLKPGDVVEIRFNCKAGESGTINVNACQLDDQLFRQAYEILAASTLELTEFTSTYVEGTVNANRDGLLYTSIPQDGNWHVTVDGKEIEPVLVGNVMISVPMTEGQHTVAFTYQNKAFDMGCKISLACLVIFVLLIWFFYRPEHPHKGKYTRV